MSMKINLIGMILHHAGESPFEDCIIGDDGTELDAVAALDAMIMDYAKARSGGKSAVVVIPERFRDAQTEQPATVPREMAVRLAEALAVCLGTADHGQGMMFSDRLLNGRKALDEARAAGLLNGGEQ